MFGFSRGQAAERLDSLPRHRGATMSAMISATGMRLLLAIPLLGGFGPAEVIWRGDFETGTLEQWKGAPKSDGIKIVQDIVREGKFALRIDGTNAAKRGALDRI